MGIAGKLAETPMLIECFGSVIEAVEDDSDEGEDLAGMVTVRQGLGEEPLAQAAALLIAVDAEPGQNRDREGATGQFADHFRREIAKVYLTCGQGVETRDAAGLIEEHLGSREPFLLVLEGIGGQPVVHLWRAAAEITARMGLAECDEVVAGGE